MHEIPSSFSESSDREPPAGADSHDESELAPAGDGPQITADEVPPELTMPDIHPNMGYARPPEQFLAPAPDAEKVAARIAAVSGEIAFPPPFRQGYAHELISLGVADDMTAGRAIVRVSRFFHDTALEGGQTAPAGAIGMSADIGYYDPAQQTWRLYPEFVHPDEQPALAAMMEDQAQLTAAQLEAQSTQDNTVQFTKLRDPVTVHVRREMAEVLQAAGLLPALIERGGLQIPDTRCDDQTTATFVLTPKVEMADLASPATQGAPDSYRIFPGHYLSVAYQGLVVSADDATTGGTRQTRITQPRYVHVATLSEEDWTTWIPDMSLVSPEEWGQIAEVPYRLQAYEQLSPGFSAQDCAVVFNRRY